MLGFSNILVGTAWAQTAAAPAVEQAAGSGNDLIRFLPILLIFAVFYFLILRPQQKKLDAIATVLKGLKKGDKIVTSGGIVGTIAKLEGDEYVVVEIASGVQVKVVRSTIHGIAEDKIAKAPSKTEDKK